jgi:hypothetical protein
MKPPFLSIVIPTREGFSEHWLNALLNIKGDVEFILVHPPGLEKSLVDDLRFHQINSIFRGEISQRLTGLLNARGTYILTINCDEYLHPEIAEISDQYFRRFPESWVLRLSRKNFPFDAKEELDQPWSELPNLGEIIGITDNSLDHKKTNLKEIPIAPLANKLDLFCLFRERKDHHGRHTENFDKKVWQNQKVQESLQDLIQLMTIFNALKYLPFWCLDRLLGLYIQAKFFKKDQIIGHILPSPEQIRIEDNPPEYRQSMRFYVFAEILLIRGFPQYGYLWNLILSHISSIPRSMVQFLKMKKKQ